MPCYHPLQATYFVLPDGKKDLKFSNVNAELFLKGLKPLGDNNLSLPCGKCMGCRLERSRQWAVRIMHEASLHDQNCFVTLTFDEDSLIEKCMTADGLFSLDRSHMQDFMKRLRSVFVPPCPDGYDKKEWVREFGVRVFYCGEYGDALSRPHYHLCLFNLDFDDKVHLGGTDFPYFTSEILSSIWGFGHCAISDLTFDSAAYVARYCTKKVTGDLAADHYQGRTPEFSQASLKPGIGSLWLDKFGRSDIFSLDECVVRGVVTKPPRYYDKRLEKDDPLLWEKTKASRVARALSKSAHSTHARLLVREKCLESRIKSLVRKLDRA